MKRGHNGRKAARLLNGIIALLSAVDLGLLVSRHLTLGFINHSYLYIRKSQFVYREKPICTNALALCIDRKQLIRMGSERSHWCIVFIKTSRLFYVAFLLLLTKLREKIST